MAFPVRRAGGIARGGAQADATGRPRRARPMREVYQMFKGELTQAQVMKAAGSDPSAQFFARLYIGLYLEATGNREAGRAQIEIAAEDRFAARRRLHARCRRVHMKMP